MRVVRNYAPVMPSPSTSSPPAASNKSSLHRLHLHQRSPMPLLGGAEGASHSAGDSLERFPLKIVFADHLGHHRGEAFHQGFQGQNGIPRRLGGLAEPADGVERLVARLAGIIDIGIA